MFLLRVFWRLWPCGSRRKHLVYMFKELLMPTHVLLHDRGIE